MLSRKRWLFDEPAWSGLKENRSGPVDDEAHLFRKIQCGRIQVYSVLSRPEWRDRPS